MLVLDVLAVLAEDSGWPTAPLHWFVRVRRTENKLELASLDYDGWLDNLLTEKPSAVMHTRPHGGIVLTASTEELQTFITANLANAEAFGDSTVYMRLEPGAVVPAPDGLR